MADSVGFVENVLFLPLVVLERGDERWTVFCPHTRFIDVGVFLVWRRFSVTILRDAFLVVAQQSSAEGRITVSTLNSSNRSNNMHSYCVCFTVFLYANATSFCHSSRLAVSQATLEERNLLSALTEAVTCTFTCTHT